MSKKLFLTFWPEQFLACSVFEGLAALESQWIGDMVPLSLDTQLGLLVPPSRENILSETGRGVAHMSKYDSVQRVVKILDRVAVVNQHSTRRESPRLAIMHYF